jgi:hypothetical protein
MATFRRGQRVIVNTPFGDVPRKPICVGSGFSGTHDEPPTGGHVQAGGGRRRPRR